MLKAVLIFTTCLTIFFNAGAQNYVLQGHIEHYTGKNLYLFALKGHRELPIDTALTDTTGHFVMQIPKKSDIGLYRLGLENMEYIDLIFNYEDIVFSTNFLHLVDSINFIKSKENKIYYSFLKETGEEHYKIELLAPLLRVYPGNDPFYTSIKNKFTSIQDYFIKKIQNVEKNHKNTYAARLISSEQDPIIYWEPGKLNQKTYLKNYFFKYIDFGDVLLLNSDLFPSKILQFFSLYSNKNFTKEEQEQEYIKAMDILFGAADETPVVFDYVLDFVIDGFERFQFDSVMDYIAENYVNVENCKDDENMEEMKKRIEKYRQLKIGKKAPAISIENMNGKETSLKDINSDYVLLVFWAGWCGHCQTILPKIENLYNMQDGNAMKVMAISLDHKEVEWKEAAEKLPGEWIHVSELKGWDSKVAEDYNIYATPTMILLDKNKKIIAKPRNTYALEQIMLEKNIFSP